VKSPQYLFDRIAGVFGLGTGVEAVAEVPRFLIRGILSISGLLDLSIMLDPPVTFAVLRLPPRGCGGGVAEGYNVLGGLIDQGHEIRRVIFTQALSPKVSQLNANFV